MFAGSILDLEPDTAYEARFVLSRSRRRRAARRSEDRDRAHAARADAGAGGRSFTSIRTASKGRRSSRRSKG